MLKKAPSRMGGQEWRLPWADISTGDLYLQAVDPEEEPIMQQGEFVIVLPVPTVSVKSGDIAVVRVKGGYSLRKVVKDHKDAETAQWDVLEDELPFSRVIGKVSHFCRDVSWKPPMDNPREIAERLLKDAQGAARENKREGEGA